MIEMNYPLYRLINKLNRKYVAIMVLATISLTARIILFPEFGWRIQLIIFFISITSITIIWTILEFVDKWLNKHMPYQQGVL